MRRHLLISFFAIVCVTTPNFAQSGFLHRDQKKIVDGSGQEVILRGMGLGGWMLQEGYMLDMSSFANPQHQIKAKIQDVLGEENTKAFYDAWLANHVTKRDIDSMAAWGFNSVRLPMHYNLYTLPIEEEPNAGSQTWLEKGFAMTDSLLKWCEANHIYLILDLHAAPGGQGNDAAISDYDTSKPSLWQSDANKDKTVALWRKLAERYANEEWIGGYDLINETNWNFTAGANKNGCDETTNAPLKELFVRITNAIREVDDNHIIFIEGNCWANNHRGLFPIWDENMAVSFHKYWNYNDKNAIQGLLDLRNSVNAPLWLGESGENSNVWFRNAIALMEENSIGWAWWPEKKFGSVVNPLTVVKTPEYENLLNYWKNPANTPKPSVESATATMMQMAENLKIENTIFRPDVIDAMFRQVHDNSTLPFKRYHVPGVVYASDFDLGRSQHAYFDKDTATYHVSGGSYTAWNSGWAYRNDGVDIKTTDDTEGNGFNIGWTKDGEWLQYTVLVDSAAAYNVTFRYSATDNRSAVKLTLNGKDISPTLSLITSSWKNLTFNDVILPAGEQKIRVHFSKGGADFSLMKFELSKKISDVAFSALGGETDEIGGKINVTFNGSIDAATLSASGFSLTVNGTPATISQVNTGSDGASMNIKLQSSVIETDEIKLSYAGSEVKSTTGVSLAAFSDLLILNKLPVHTMITSKIEAENFYFNQGLQAENCQDIGQGQNMGYTTTGDYLDYLIRVPYDSMFVVDVRIACNATAGKIEFQQLTKTDELVNSATVDVPVTGGWQTWSTVSTTMRLNAGSYKLRLKILKPEFNINWFKFTPVVPTGTDKKKIGKINVYPNPAEKTIKIELPESVHFKENDIYIRHLDGRIVKRITNATLEQIGSITLEGLKAGMYLIEFECKGVRWANKFIVR
jgi:endoglucanase